MSATMHEAKIVWTTPDPEHWTPEHRAAGEHYGDEAGWGTYDDFAYTHLLAHLRAAADQYAQAHPDLVGSEIMIL